MKRWLMKGSFYLNMALLALLLTIALQAGLFERWRDALHAPANMSSLVALASGQPKPDTVTAIPWWQDEVQYRLNITRNQQYNNCVFGDSITSGLGNTLGDRTFNFALSGMSSVSLLEQLRREWSVGVRCNQVIIAMGTNDAEYIISNNQFVTNMRQAIALSRQLQANRIVLLPAFYSTIAASQNIDMAGPIARVNEINRLLQQVASSEQVSFLNGRLQPLYQGQALREDLTTDGVHLNAKGRIIYRNVLLQLLRSA
ncbi:MAG: SGNH/GDSL hydrolase family protein [Stenomitos rutilans HA7619-LM2]|jgi:lysophospholipase L1-like esterase|nr:SGNH/GDSL hydrolase family protein [Stenomitos rutilans HA7619-LM2]